MIYVTFLIAVAFIIWMKLHYVFILIAAIVGICKVWVWLCWRYPRTMFYIAAFISGFVRGLFGRR